MILGKREQEHLEIKANSISIKESDRVVLLGITIDNWLNFKKHIENLCRAANYKLQALIRIRKYLTLGKAKLLSNAFIYSQLSYAQYIWMFCLKESYNKIVRIYHNTLKVVNQTNGIYEDLLHMSNEVSIHQNYLCE